MTNSAAWKSSRDLFIFHTATFFWSCTLHLERSTLGVETTGPSHRPPPWTLAKLCWNVTRALQRSHLQGVSFSFCRGNSSSCSWFEGSGQCLKTLSSKIRPNLSSAQQLTCWPKPLLQTSCGAVVWGAGSVTRRVSRDPWSKRTRGVGDGQAATGQELLSCSSRWPGCF